MTFLVVFIEDLLATRKVPLDSAPIRSIGYLFSNFSGGTGSNQAYWIPFLQFFQWDGLQSGLLDTIFPIFPVERAPIWSIGYHFSNFSSGTGSNQAFWTPVLQFSQWNGLQSSLLDTFSPIFPVGRAPIKPIVIPFLQFFQWNGLQSSLLDTFSPIFPVERAPIRPIGYLFFK